MISDCHCEKYSIVLLDLTVSIIDTYKQLFHLRSA